MLLPSVSEDFVIFNSFFGGVARGLFANRVSQTSSNSGTNGASIDAMSLSRLAAKISRRFAADLYFGTLSFSVRASAVSEAAL